MKKWDLPVFYDDLDWKKGEKKSVRDQYVKEQNGKCMWCNRPLGGPPPTEIQKMPIDESLYPPNMFEHPVHLQHNRKSGLTEGAVHAKCNAVMWEYYGR
jgi:hypothetical protein